ncbi:small-conductance mechanosensitive channel [Striga asiatica]|uniref:Small-conductance mechanosensitive channel n=1 Tax=Striga asiatica TaxID=4170 RepID=A0A5A7QXE5_STRAF|nr:small-conductance mechanosensitive channel [Striga asiatica]
MVYIYIYIRRLVEELYFGNIAAAKEYWTERPIGADRKEAAALVVKIIILSSPLLDHSPSIKFSMPNKSESPSLSCICVLQSTSSITIINRLFVLSSCLLISTELMYKLASWQLPPVGSTFRCPVAPAAGNPSSTPSPHSSSYPSSPYKPVQVLHHCPLQIRIHG